MNCILGFSRCNNEINEIEIINSTVTFLDFVGAIMFEIVKQEIGKDQEMQRLIDSITNIADYDNFMDYLTAYSK